MEEAPIEARKCTRIPEWFEATGWSPEGDFVLKPEAADLLAFANDGSGYQAELLTLPTFGCVMHEPTPQRGALDATPNLTWAATIQRRED